ncbi:Conserved protein containing a Zn-ribbon-like motif, possibly RNA-binding [Actinopolyspora lacussalsi subsp. righensis]|uniref:Conserved protein containing a Zn-ribbon-like motif, possibly RNA-binding n=1 Tax=Actinopolyspora righensis TaxID=995060 RepID=A0A1I7CFS8_9ACTN|nr:CGNR zinc finger domain-containing protein [Actinopolyspora righensis]SFT98269.1 Conserved protein containing a Zn-ribbon-like motif, possibly RNA-binding [Actinopolyspora righensis]
MKIDFSDYTVGAALATALVNTSPAIRRTTDEVLTSPTALRRFLTEHGVTTDTTTPENVPSDDDLARVKRLREEIRTLLATGDVEELVEGATTLLARATATPTVLLDSHRRWQWGLATSPDASVAEELAALVCAGLLGTLHALSHERFRHCAATECDGMFIDTSKAGRRRYCTPQICGNRQNVARHRARQRHTKQNPHP